MNDFLAETMRRAADELQAACDEHTASYPGGDWKAANDRIEVARNIADAALDAANLWPSTQRYLGNDAVLRILRSADVSTSKSG